MPKYIFIWCSYINKWYIITYISQISLTCMLHSRTERYISGRLGGLNLPGRRAADMIPRLCGEALCNAIT